jgi:subtilisin
MSVSPQVRDALKRKGMADVMAYVKMQRAGSRSHGRLAIELSLDDLARCFVTDDRSVFRRIAESAKHGRRPNAGDTHIRYFPSLGVILGTVDEALLSTLLDRLPIKHVSAPLAASLIRPLDRRLIASPSRAVTWGISRLGIEAVWNRGFTGAGVKIAHLDTGVDPDHATLKNAVVDFAFFDDGGEIDTLHPNAFDTDDHGTHTAATMIGRAVGGKHVGMAPAAQLASAAIIEGGWTQARILGGMQWAIDKRARIINISLGVRGFSNDFLLLTQRLRGAGLLPVFAVGNEGVNTSRAPGNYDEALSVGASGDPDDIPTFSSSEEIDSVRSVPDLVAPGQNIESALAGGGFLSMSGTSMSAPHISGLAALLVEARPDATVDQLEQAIFLSCTQLGGVAPVREGRGVPSANRALDALLAM